MGGNQGRCRCETTSSHSAREEDLSVRAIRAIHVLAIPLDLESRAVRYDRLTLLGFQVDDEGNVLIPECDQVVACAQLRGT